MEEKNKSDIDSMMEKAIELLGFKPIVLYEGKNYYPAQLSYSINKADNTIIDAVIKFPNNKPEKDFINEALDNVLIALKDIVNINDNIENYKLLRIFDDENNILKEYNLQSENK